MATRQIVSILKRYPKCLLDELVRACPDLTWNQVFTEIDRMSRDGKVLLAQKSPGVYIVSLPVRMSGVRL